MNRYDGKTGRVEHIPDPDLTVNTAAFGTIPEPSVGNGRAEYKKPSGAAGVLDGISGIFSRIKKSVPEIEDMVLVGVLYLLYKESGDIEFLLIAGAMLFM